jgi:hypothetical protein
LSGWLQGTPYSPLPLDLARPNHADRYRVRANRYRVRKNRCRVRHTTAGSGQAKPRGQVQGTRKPLQGTQESLQGTQASCRVRLAKPRLLPLLGAIRGIRGGPGPSIGKCATREVVCMAASRFLKFPILNSFAEFAAHRMSSNWRARL